MRYIRITGFSFKHAPKKLNLKEVVGGFTVEVKYSYSSFRTSVTPAYVIFAAIVRKR